VLIQGKDCIIAGNIVEILKLSIIMINWNNIDTVLLDMDGTLLDLNYDNQFWQQQLPRRFAEKHNISIETAKETLFNQFKDLEGTINWYCIDYWTEALDMDIALLKAETAHLIAIHPHVINFLSTIRSHGKRAVLVTNAHQKTLALKLEQTQLEGHLDAVVCAHDLKLPKENPQFWALLQTVEPFDSQRTLLVDDNLFVLRSANDYGIAYLLAVQNPDSCGPEKPTEEFNAISSFKDIIPS